MATFTVNGTQYTGDDSRKLMDFLREELRLTSVKNGCNQGACGACTVLVDGRASRACIFTLGKLQDKNVLTVEGLSAREKEVYAFAFAEAGAVQCGFCIPGMVISAKGLLDAEPTPSSAAIKKALRGNICRCTGYVKIEDAVQIAARLLREDAPIPKRVFSGQLGEDFHRVDAEEKTLGTGEYVDDVVVEGMLFGSAVRPPAPRIRVLKIDAAEALAHPDCEAVLTAADVPGDNKIGHLSFISDYDVFIAEGGITRFLGDALALVVSRRKESLEAIKKLVRLDYEELTPITSPAAAMAEGAPQLHSIREGNILAHEHLTKGKPDAALAASKYVVTQHYSVPFTEHAFMEPECALAMPEGKNGVFMYTGAQNIFDEQRECARMLGVEPALVHIQSKLVGGGFGGKEDMSVQHHACLAAYLLRKPVKVQLTRAESLLVHPKRHAMEMDFTTGCDENGRLTALKATIVSDTGAYASLGPPVLQRACTHASGPYSFESYDIDGKAVYTNNPPGGAFRGFGVSQSQFAMENNLNLLAEQVGISPWEIRYLNAVRPGQRLPNGQVVDGSTGIVGCLEAVRDVYEKAEIAGIACSFKNSGLGVGLPDIGRCTLSVEGGRVHIRSGAACIGQGMATVTTQITCEALGIPPELTVTEPPDTRRTPNAGTTTASRQTTLTGEATRVAAMRLRAELDKLTAAGKSIQQALAELEGWETLGEFLGATDPLNNDKADPIYHVAYGYAAEVVELYPDGRVREIHAAFDMGRVINPKAAEGQIEGGIVMGLGYAFTEDFPLVNSVPTAKYGTLGLWRATEVPPIHTQFVRGPQLNEMAFGAKGCGEIATIPTAPAASGAYYALDGKLRGKLPMEDTFYRKAK